MDIKETKTIKSKLADKLATMQVLGCIMKNPLLLKHKDFPITIEDFPEQFHRIIFGAIEYLVAEGADKLGYVDIDQFLCKYEIQHKVFSDNKGLEYITRATQIAEESNFEYYYKIFKKFSLLNRLVEKGFDISAIYDDTILDPVKLVQMQKQFDSLSVNDIINYVELKLIDIKQDFGNANNIVQCKAGQDLRDNIEKLKQTPDIGLSLQSPKLTTIYRGQRLGGFYVESSAQGVGKSRRMAGESAHLAVPEYYDLQKKKWVITNIQENVLYISTELQLNEVQTIWVANISGVEEEKILDGKYTAAEEQRVLKAISLIEKANLYFVQITNYDIDDIENLIKKYYQKYQVNYVYYDYLSTTIKIMTEVSSKTRMNGLREDQILLQFCTRLKDLCTELGIFIWSATQLSGEWKTVKEADQQLLRGAKSISDKIDIGSILLPVRETDKPLIDQYMKKGFQVPPTHCIHIYKVRRGHFNNIKLYVNFDRALARMTDCFVTNNEGKMLEVKDTNIEIVLDTTAEKKYGYDF